ncbi:hypothetical protein ACTL32_05265 [Planococcus sp. FY231025]|uniref:hypothetical protein n=1 Tax=Planococcus sp. FY231025 TaxID=3455699 RepID=UPI003F8DD57C
MTNDLKFFKELDEKLFMKIGYQTSEMTFSYTKDGQKFNLELEEQESSLNNQTIFLDDKQGIWDPNKHDFTIQMNYSLNNPGFLFKENGLADPGSTIGVALSWYSKSSSQRGIEKIGLITANIIGAFEGEINHTFSKKQLIGEVTVEVILYLESPSSVKQPHYADQAGTIFGLLDSRVIIIDGQGSVFPITEVYAPERPLWFVTFNFTDPMSDPFTEDYICINLNSAHRNFHLISGKKGTSDGPLLSEVIAGALQVIIQKVMEDSESENILNGIGFEDGTIAQAVYYFLTNFEWDISSPERLAETIRKDWETRIGSEYA